VAAERVVAVGMLAERVLAAGAPRARSAECAGSRSCSRCTGSSEAIRPCRPGKLRNSVFQVPDRRPDTSSCRSRRPEPVDRPRRSDRRWARSMTAIRECAYRRDTFADRSNRPAPVCHPCRPGWDWRPGTCPSRRFASRRHRSACRPRRRAPAGHPCRLEREREQEWRSGTCPSQGFASRRRMSACRARRRAPAGHSCRHRPRSRRRFGQSAMTRKEREPMQETCVCHPCRLRSR
jgi:hypothetical protein